MNKDSKKTDPKPPEVDWERKAAEYLGGWQRCKADYENLQRDSERRVSEAIKFGTEGLLTELAPMIDHFNYAFAGIPEEERESNWLKGIQHIQTNFLKVLEEHGVELIKTVGEQFDAELHEAVEEVEDAEQKSGTIVAEMAAGFTLNGKVIRHAKVKLVK